MENLTPENILEFLETELHSPWQQCLPGDVKSSIFGNNAEAVVLSPYKKMAVLAGTF